MEILEVLGFLEIGIEGNSPDFRCSFGITMGPLGEMYLGADRRSQAGEVDFIFEILVIGWVFSSWLTRWDKKLLSSICGLLRFLCFGLLTIDLFILILFLDTFEIESKTDTILPTSFACLLKKFFLV